MRNISVSETIWESISWSFSYLQFLLKFLISIQDCRCSDQCILGNTEAKPALVVVTVVMGVVMVSVVVTIMNVVTDGECSGDDDQCNDNDNCKVNIYLPKSPIWTQWFCRSVFFCKVIWERGLWCVERHDCNRDSQSNPRIHITPAFLFRDFSSTSCSTSSNARY